MDGAQGTQSAKVHKELRVLLIFARSSFQGCVAGAGGRGMSRWCGYVVEGVALGVVKSVELGDFDQGTGFRE